MIANYSTQVVAERSLAEIMHLLAVNGASHVLVENSPSGQPSSLAFRVKGMGFRLPIYADAVVETLKRDGAEKRFLKLDHATDVAWRIVRDWLRAQLALIDSGMVALDEIMLPYAITSSGLTALERYRSGTLMLDAPMGKGER